ncbi:unnamed protein product [Malus baccata var. baccata]
MACPFDYRLDWNIRENADMPSQDNIWHPSFISPNRPLTIGDSVMKNDITATVVATNLLTPKGNRILSKRSDELVVQDSLAFSVQCANSVSNMGQRLLARFLARTRQVESLMVEVRHLLPSSFRVLPSVEAPNNQPSALFLPGVSSSDERYE